ncbi:hypothetical protein FRC02_002135 [Tulasnella sp. 418]|nr:hypothetical protein FRC02_002135 [Tulasnella sp. 418]
MTLSIQNLYRRRGLASAEAVAPDSRRGAPIQASAANSLPVPRATPLSLSGTPVDGSSQTSIQESLAASRTSTAVDPGASGSTLVVEEPGPGRHAQIPVGQVRLPQAQTSILSTLLSSRMLNIF